jgi:tetratricopeptide (TPR) repeat protein
MSEPREEQIKRMISEGKVSPEEGQRLLEALAKSRSGETGIKAARQVGKKTDSHRRLFLLLLVVAVAALAAGLTLGLYYSLRSTDSAAELMEKGEKAFAVGDYDRAIELYTDATKKEPGSSAAYNLLGMAYRFKYNETADRKYKQEEINAFKKAIDLDPTNYVPYINLGATLFYQNETQQAVLYLNKALELYPDNPERATIEEMIRQSE